MCCHLLSWNLFSVMWCYLCSLSSDVILTRRNVCWLSNNYELIMSNNLLIINVYILIFVPITTFTSQL